MSRRTKLTPWRTGSQKAFHGRLLGTMQSGIQGFGIAMTEAEAIALSQNPQVELVEEDANGHLASEVPVGSLQAASRPSQNLPGRTTPRLLPKLLSVPTTCAWITEYSYYRCPAYQRYTDDAFWALDRLDNLGLIVASASGTLENKTYRFATTGLGSGSQYTQPVRAYVIDSGIYKDHQEFDAGRVIEGANMIIDPDVSDTVTRTDEEPPVTLYAADYYPPNNPCGAWRGSEDNTTHGTAVGSVIGGNNTGVAKNVTLVPVKVSNCPPPTEMSKWRIPKLAVARGLDWVIHDLTCWNYDFGHEPADLSLCQARPSRGVVNMSIHFETNAIDSVNNQIVRDEVCEDGNGGYTNCVSALENNVNIAIEKGIPVVVSANNRNTDWCYHPDNPLGASQTPARMGQHSDYPTWFGSFPSTYHTITVGGTRALASNYVDERWLCAGAGDDCTTEPGVTNEGSNYGDCVSIWAPAYNIRLASGTGSGNYRAAGPWSSGTSFSAGYVTGVVARLLQLNPSLTPLDVWNSLVFRANERCTEPGAVCPASFDPTHDNHKLVYMGAAE